jgi:hypothetical protein
MPFVKIAIKDVHAVRRWEKLSVALLLRFWISSFQGFARITKLDAKSFWSMALRVMNIIRKTAISVWLIVPLLDVGKVVSPDYQIT